MTGMWNERHLLIQGANRNSSGLKRANASVLKNKRLKRCNKAKNSTALQPWMFRCLADRVTETMDNRRALFANMTNNANPAQLNSEHHYPDQRGQTGRWNQHNSHMHNM